MKQTLQLASPVFLAVRPLGLRASCSAPRRPRPERQELRVSGPHRPALSRGFSEVRPQTFVTLQREAAVERNENGKPKHNRDTY